MDKGRPLRAAGALIAVAVVVALVLVLGRDDEPSRFTGPPANDPVTLLCRSASDEVSSACQTAYFACRDHRGEITDDADLPRGTRLRTVAAAYVASDWSDWGGPVQDAAGRGCRAGLRS